MTGKEDKVDEVVSPEEITPEPVTFTQEEHETALADKDKAYQGLQRVINEKDTKIQELESRPQSTENKKEILELRKQMARLEDVVTAKEVDDLEPKPKSKSRLEVLEGEIRLESEKEWTEKLREFQEIAKSVGKDAYNDSEFEDARNFFTAQRPDFALQKARQIAKRIQGENPIVEPEKEPKTVKLEDLSPEDQERLGRAILDKSGLTENIGGAPSGTVSSWEQTERDFADGKITYAKYAEARKRENID